ncbi:hypothetical protein C2S52_021812 [Perilla frutescens var. hirtella]|nr:hypothetical protein C2S52_021812 [Perilla frutescens var. hirtella]KAH6807715.1 hypothetical protein C2S51_028823 [Perilla frutescens var. frutescens]
MDSYNISTPTRSEKSRTENKFELTTRSKFKGAIGTPTQGRSSRLAQASNSDPHPIAPLNSVFFAAIVLVMVLCLSMWKRKKEGG